MDIPYCSDIFNFKTFYSNEQFQNLFWVITIFTDMEWRMTHLAIPKKKNKTQNEEEPEF